MGGTIFWFGFHHLREMLILSKFLKSEMTFIDIGASQGKFALFAASVLKKVRVIAFEQTSGQLNLLKNIIALNQFKNVEVCEYDLFKEEKQIEVFTSNDSALHKGHHEGLSTIYPSNARNISEGIIEFKIFDDIHFDKLERFDVLKIDIEGAELPALKRMSKSLLKFKPFIIIEMSETNYKLAGYGINDAIEFFSQFGYKSYRFHLNERRPLNSYSKSGSDNIVYI
ncbi:MAG: FkbM family methyltransferase, partial [Crocinitomix sp.]|nr:FkbM family methyltransferase [Crocinitomix sp.]